ncbi:hypothetical protein, partial [Nonomuraea lactucae]|uniref:hypothetical protein n=1 Tax=Nonomuraea lactucae TaxID=2249762 RepID=UPI0019637F0D
MPKVRDPLAPTDTAGRWEAFSPRSSRPSPRSSRPSPRFPQPSTRPSQPFSTGSWEPFPGVAAQSGARERQFYLPRPAPGDVLDDEQETQELPAVIDFPPHRPPARATQSPAAPASGSLFTPRERGARAAEPVYRMPPSPAPRNPDPRASESHTAGSHTASPHTSERGTPEHRAPERRTPERRTPRPGAGSESRKPRASEGRKPGRTEGRRPGLTEGRKPGASEGRRTGAFEPPARTLATFRSPSGGT